MLTDLRHSLRVLLRNPLVGSVAVLSLALGIGGAASVFTVLNAIVLRDLPVPNPQQLYAAEKHRAAEVSHALLVADDRAGAAGGAGPRGAVRGNAADADAGPADARH